MGTVRPLGYKTDKLMARVRHMSMTWALMAFSVFEQKAKSGNFKGEDS